MDSLREFRPCGFLRVKVRRVGTVSGKLHACLNWPARSEYVTGKEVTHLPCLVEEMPLISTRHGSHGL